MKGLDLITAVLLSALLHSNADVSESRNLKLPFNSLQRIPSPLQSLLPPTAENPIKDYTVGLVPPPVESPIQQAASGPAHPHHNALVHSHIPNYDTRVVNPVLQLRSAVQPKGGQSIGSVHAIHHQTHHSANRLQPQTVVYPQYQRVNSYHDRHHHHHLQQQQQQLNTYGTGFQHTHHSAPITQSAVYQHSAHTLHRQPSAHVQHFHTARVQQSAILPRPVSSSGVRTIQTYPSVSFDSTVPHHGSTLNLRNSNLDPELVSIIREVLQRHNF